MARAWYVARTKPRQERQTAVVLGERGVEAYFPMIAPRRATGKLEPLFPGYLFVRLDLGTPDWLVSRSAPGVAYFLGGDGGEPTELPEGLVEEIRERVERKEYGRSEPRFRTGDRVVIVGGPFDGLEAVFDGTLSAAGRSRVLVELVSRLVPVSVEIDRIRQAI